ncbi:uncharacterized protein BDR25DRAFT_393622 [Lindgomyces ingoldianus]|uniref:Uncharacterized protein n=1 Tax=Lindgomyces ingoldianus TaxID=673940 RepID=A0ACB6QVR8_9PLEO|nr:uncharacterized protein BDR25DRAFT_393622 [Lindgomyces ingoldianus]KAF2471031.1 hypothetical protein BDR25DRAFT_393622 [Lindgomyces ingoldianus]
MYLRLSHSETKEDIFLLRKVIIFSKNMTGEPSETSGQVSIKVFGVIFGEFSNRGAFYCLNLGAFIYEGVIEQHTLEATRVNQPELKELLCGEMSLALNVDSPPPCSKLASRMIPKRVVWPSSLVPPNTGIRSLSKLIIAVARRQGILDINIRVLDYDDKDLDDSFWLVFIGKHSFQEMVDVIEVEINFVSNANSLKARNSFLSFKILAGGMFESIFDLGSYECISNGVPIGFSLKIAAPKVRVRIWVLKAWREAICILVREITEPRPFSTLLLGKCRTSCGFDKGTHTNFEKFKEQLVHAIGCVTELRNNGLCVKLDVTQTLNRPQASQKARGEGDGVVYEWSGKSFRLASPLVPSYKTKALRPVLSFLFNGPPYQCCCETQLSIHANEKFGVIFTSFCHLALRTLTSLPVRAWRDSRLHLASESPGPISKSVSPRGSICAIWCPYGSRCEDRVPQSRESWSDTILKRKSEGIIRFRLLWWGGPFTIYHLFVSTTSSFDYSRLSFDPLNTHNMRLWHANC